MLTRARFALTTACELAALVLVVLAAFRFDVTVGFVAAGVALFVFAEFVLAPPAPDAKVTPPDDDPS